MGKRRLAGLLARGPVLSRLARRNRAKIANLDLQIAGYEERVTEAKARLDDLRDQFHTGGVTRADFQGQKLLVSGRLRELSGAMNRLRKQRLNLERAIREESEEEQDDLFHEDYLSQEEEREADKEVRRERRTKKGPATKVAAKGAKAAAGTKEKVVAALTPAEKKARAFVKGFVAAYREGAKGKGPKVAKRLELVSTYPYHVTLVAQGQEHLMVFGHRGAEALRVQLIEGPQFDLAQFPDIIRTCFVDVSDWSESAGRTAGAAQLTHDLG